MSDSGEWECHLHVYSIVLTSCVGGEFTSNWHGLVLFNWEYRQFVTSVV